MTFVSHLYGTGKRHISSPYLGPYQLQNEILKKKNNKNKNKVAK